MGFNPKTETLALRIWSHCTAIEWDTNIGSVADAINEPMGRVRRVLAIKGWSERLRAHKQSHSGAPAYGGIE